MNLLVLIALLPAAALAVYIYRKDGRSTLHRYMDGNPEDVSAQYPDRKADLERYIKGIVQLSYQMLQDGTTRCNK